MTQFINKTIYIRAQLKLCLAHIKCSTYIDFGIENNDKDLKSKISDHVRISKYKNTLAKGSSFAIKNVKNTVPWTYVFTDLNDEENVKTF